MKTIIMEPDALYAAVSEEVQSLLSEKPDAVIAMSAGRTMRPLWESMKSMDLSRVRLFETADFCGGKEPLLLRAEMEDHLLAESNLKKENCFWLTEENYMQADAAIASFGGLDLAVLGIGDNAHIGFNEPATQFAVRSHRQKLTEKTRRQYAWRFGSEDAVPEWGVTLGIRTLTEARKILVLASGAEKAQPVFDMLYARDDSIIPAAFLQIPSNVIVYADPAAAAKL